MLTLAGCLFLSAFAGMIVATPLCISLGSRWGILDFPGPRKIHRNPIPLTGGWALFGVLSGVLWVPIVSALAFRETSWVDSLPTLLASFVGKAPELAGRMMPFYASSLAIFALGAADDIRGLSPRTRLAVQLTVACYLVGAGFRPGLDFLPSWLACAIGVLWLVGITNAFNLLDGLDGLATGVALIATVSFLGVMMLAGRVETVCLLAAAAGLQVGFLRYNSLSAKVFLGSSGSLLLGHLLAVAGIEVSLAAPAAAEGTTQILIPLLALALPIYDTTSVVFIRLHRGKPITVGDRNHVHHRLLYLGFTPKGALGLLCVVASTFGLAALCLAAGGWEWLVPLLLAPSFALLALPLANPAHAPAAHREEPSSMGRHAPVPSAPQQQS